MTMGNQAKMVHMHRIERRPHFATGWYGLDIGSLVKTASGTKYTTTLTSECTQNGQKLHLCLTGVQRGCRVHLLSDVPLGVS